MYDIISIGDSTIDHLAQVEDATVNCTIDKDHCLLCFHYADKIPVSRLNQEVAGNAANNAAGSARLGLKTSLWTIVGDDDGGNMIYQKMLDEKVSCEWIEILEGGETNYSIVINFEGERTILIYHNKRKYDLPHFPKSEWVYLTSMGEGWETIISQLLHYLKRENAKLAFNPGTFQLKSGLDVLRPLFAVTDVLFVNKEEAQMLVNNSKRGEISFLLMALKKEGPELVVITDGSKGSYAYDGVSAYYMDICPASVVEKTGAGDSYGTAFVAALYYSKSIEEAMRWGTVNSASVIAKIGPQAGLLKKDELEDWSKNRCPVEATRM